MQGSVKLRHSASSSSSWLAYAYTVINVVKKQDAPKIWGSQVGVVIDSSWTDVLECCNAGN